MKSWLFLVGATFAFALGGCGTETGDASGSGAGTCVDYTTVDPNACNGGACSFKNDVVPIYRKSCALSNACHTGSTAQEGLVLGKPLADGDMTPAELAEIHAATVGVDAARANMKLIVAGDPGASFMLAKLEYSDFKLCSEIECAAKGCGGRMPTGGDKLPAAEIAVLNAWIKAGAAND
ncbi:MAG: hypothetical protein EXR75_00715 [Myxococcales bacterium]|nr:hypothetical protein [Myxococcales bacterium]